MQWHESCIPYLLLLEVNATSQCWLISGWKGLCEARVCNMHGHIQIGPPKGIEVMDLVDFSNFLRKIPTFILANNLNFGLSEIVEGTFLKIPIFRQQIEFSNFRPDFLLWRSNLLYSWCMTLYVWCLNLYFCCLNLYFGCLNLYIGCLNLYFGCLNLYSGYLNLYYGCLNLYFGCLNLYFGCLNFYRLCWVSELILLGIRGPSIPRTRESGNTEGPSILVWTVNLEMLKDQAFCHDLWIWKYWRIGTCGLPAHFKTMGLEPADFRPISRRWDWNAWAPRPFGPGLVPC